MPYTRQLLLATPALRWQHVTLDEARPAWSERYRVAGERLLIPLAGRLACELGGRSWTGDPVAAFWFTPEQTYRLRQPVRGQPSLVLELPGFAARPGRYGLVAGAHLRLAQLRRRLGEAEALALEEGLLQWAAQLLHAGGEAQAHPAVERARDYLAQHFERTDTLADIARAAAASPFHLARMFRRATGSSLHAHRTRLRMVEALRRIERGERDLAQLALGLGFSSHSHFTSVFRRTYGVAPAQLRRNLVAASP